MRSIAMSCCLLVLTLAGCGPRSAADKVGGYFDNKADAMDALADQQPTAQAKQIYHNRANALREEGKDREKGLRQSNAGTELPRMSNVEANAGVAEGNSAQ